MRRHLAQNQQRDQPHTDSHSLPVYRVRILAGSAVQHYQTKAHDEQEHHQQERVEVDTHQLVARAQRAPLRQVADEIASEHVQVMTKDPDYFLDNMSNYGALFLGAETNVSYGDKVVVTNHTLPTKKAARYTGGLSVGKFIKTVTYQRMSRDANREVAAAAARISRLEGMEGHVRAGDDRLKKYFPETEFETRPSV